MLSWTQCGFLWLFVVVTFAAPVVRKIAFRLSASVLGALVFVVFLLLNSYNHAPSVRGQPVEYYGYPYSYYDNRDASYRPLRNFSNAIPGDRWNSDARICPPSLLGNFAVYFLAATLLAWPISVLELVMARRKRRPPDEETRRLHERPSWAR